MNSRERVKRAVEGSGPDRIPLLPDVQKSAWLGHGEALEEYLNSLPLDRGPFRCVHPEEFGDDIAGSSWMDDWGCVWKRGRAGEYGTVLDHPLSDWSRFDSYTFPDESPGERNDTEKESPFYRIVSGAREYGVLWYRMQFLRGFENLMVDLAEAPERVHLLLEGILEKREAYLRKAVGGDHDAVHFGDCWGTQSALMINPGQWRTIFRPAYQRLFDIVHEAGKAVVFQSDGYTLDIVDDLVEMGADVLRPSVGIMPMDELSSKMRGKTCLWSDPCRQHVLPGGTPEEVREHIRDILRCFADPSGGVIGGLYIYDDIPLENVRAALETYLE